VTPEERADKLFYRIVNPATGEFDTNRPSQKQIADAIRAAVAEEREATEDRCKKALHAGLLESRPFIAQQIQLAAAQEREACRLAGRFVVKAFEDIGATDHAAAANKVVEAIEARNRL
jgi:hypothetical protein